MKKIILLVSVMILLVNFASFAAGGEEGAEGKQIKIGFIVKDAQEPWFLNEWKYADVAAEEKGFSVIKIEGADGEMLMTALDNLGAQQAQGVIICVPDVKLGTAVVARAKANNLKLMTVDDRLLGSDGNPMEDVVHMGISSFEIGKLVGNAIADEIENRGWNMDEVSAMRISFNELPTAKERTDGATESLLARGFNEANIIEAPQKYGTEGAFDAANIVIAKSPDVKKWVLFGLNDEAVLGGVRALEGNGIDTNNIIGVGIGGADSAVDEFKKSEATGFFGAVVISSKRHGYETTMNMYNWIANGVEPPKVTFTAGQLATRADYIEVRKELGME